MGPHPAVVTGMGVVAGNGYDLDEWRSALRSATASPVTPADPAGWPSARLDPDRVQERLRDELATYGRTRLPGVRRSGTLLAGAVAALEAWRRARGGSLAPDRVGIVIAGHDLTAEVGALAADSYTREPAHVLPSAALRMWDSDLIGLMSEVCGIRGEAAVVGGASASGLVALHHARALLADGMDAVLVVAPPLVLVDWQAQALQSIGAMSVVPDAACLPFDTCRTGFVPGEVAAALVLETEPSAVARGATWQARHLASTVLLSGTCGPEPSAEAESRVMRQALIRARVTAGDVSYVNAHGTASPRGDVDEIAALSEVFGSVIVNSTKALIGHGLTAAGLAEYVATALQLGAGFAHPMRHLEHPEPLVGLRIPAGDAVPLPGRTGLTASYAFAGIHAAAVLEGGEVS